MNCEICCGDGYWFNGNTMVICKCQQKAMLKSKKESCGITPHLMKQTLESFDLSLYTEKRKIAAQKALQASKSFVADYLKGQNPEGLLFLGSVGSGKTFLASAIIGRLLEKEVDAKLIVLHEFLDDARDAVKNDSPLRLINQIRTIPVLAIDDLGADNNTEFANNTVFSILNYRLNYELPTIVTTNLSYTQIQEVYGSRIRSRLTEMCRFYPMESDKDIRLTLNQKEKKAN